MKSPVESEDTKKHRQKSAAILSNEGKKWFNLIEFDPTEELVYEIRKHPFGLFVILATGGLIVLALSMLAGLALAFGTGESLGIASIGTLTPLLVVAVFALLIITAVATLIGVYLYRSSVIFITSEKIAQVNHISLFHRKISQLSIGDVQDVSVTQSGIFPHMFGYGTLTIETAGEQQNYSFTFVPDPYSASKVIVGAHEKNLQLHGN